MFAIDKEKIYWKKVEGETVILNIDSGFYYTLDEIGSAIWDRVILNHGLEGIISGIVDEFDIDEGSASKDIAALLKNMEREDLLKFQKKGRTDGK